MKPILIIWTCAEVEEARKIVKELLEHQWIACANLVPVESLYVWEGKMETGKEVKVFIKTFDHCFEKVKGWIQKKCSYEVPEISKIYLDGGNPSYFQWMEKIISSN